MTVSQDWANRYLGNVEPQISQAMGVPVPETVKVVVLTEAEFADKFGAAGDSYTAKGIVYVKDTVTPERAKYVVAYEAAHATAMGDAQNVGTHFGDNGGLENSTPGGAGKATEAIAHAVATGILGLPGGQPLDAHASRYAALSPQDMATVVGDIHNENYTDINTSLQPTNDNGGGNGGGGPNTGTGATTGNNMPEGGMGGIGAIPNPNKNGTYAVQANGVTRYYDSQGNIITEQQYNNPNFGGNGPVLNPLGAQAGKAVAKPEDYLSDLATMGLPITNELRKLVQDATTKGSGSYNETVKEFEYAVRQSDTYAKTYPGIIGPNGAQIMSEDAYNGYVRSYMGVANAAGLSIGRNEIGHLLSRNVSVDEFKTRVDATQKIEQNRIYFNQFNKTLTAMGMKPLDEAGIQQFVMGEASPEFYKLWEEASTRGAAASAGIAIGPHAEGPQGLGDVSLTRGEIRTAEHATGGAATQQQFAELAQNLRTLLPQSRYQKFNLSKQDLTELEFGGARQSAIADRVTQIIANETARTQGTGVATLKGNAVGQRGAGTAEGF